MLPALPYVGMLLEMCVLQLLCVCMIMALYHCFPDQFLVPYSMNGTHLLNKRTPSLVLGFHTQLDACMP